MNPTINTVVKMMETLSETAQNRVVNHLREYIEEIKDEIQWDMKFKSSQDQLIAAARHAKQEIKEGQSKPMEDEQL